MMGAVICFGMAAMNVVCALTLPMGLPWLNWASAVFCFGMGIATGIVASRR